MCARVCEHVHVCVCLYSLSLWLIDVLRSVINIFFNTFQKYLTLISSNMFSAPFHSSFLDFSYTYLMPPQATEALS